MVQDLSSGDIAQLVERTDRTREVRGSSPLISRNLKSICVVIDQRNPLNSSTNPAQINTLLTLITLIRKSSVFENQMIIWANAGY
jgi:hypothetical protein